MFDTDMGTVWVQKGDHPPHGPHRVQRISVRWVHFSDTGVPAAMKGECYANKYDAFMALRRVFEGRIVWIDRKLAAIVANEGEPRA